MAAVNERQRAQGRVRSRHQRLRIKAQIDAYKLERGCVDCGYREHAEALDFDHRGDKTGHIARIKQFGNAARLWAEIEKCDVRCANCHRVRHRDGDEAGADIRPTPQARLFEAA